MDFLHTHIVLGLLLLVCLYRRLFFCALVHVRSYENCLQEMLHSLPNNAVCDN